MNDLKYLIFIPKGCDAISSRAIVFNGVVTHVVIKIALEAEGHKVVSGGFCSVRRITVWGESVSIRNLCGVTCESRPQDVEIIRNTLSEMPGPLMPK